MTRQPDNPDALPTEAGEPPWSLPQETEFLFNDEVIAAVGTLTLPKVCVLTGEKQHLNQKTSVLRATPTRLIVQLVILGNAATAVSVGLIWRDSSSSVAVAMLILLSWLAAIMGSVKLWKKRHTLELTWFVSKTELDRMRLRHERTKWILPGLAVLIILGWQLAVGTETFEMAVMIGILLMRPFLLPDVLGTAGCYKGLVLVKGLKPPFIRQLRGMAKPEATIVNST